MPYIGLRQMHLPVVVVVGRLYLIACALLSVSPSDLGNLQAAWNLQCFNLLPGDYYPTGIQPSSVLIQYL